MEIAEFNRLKELIKPQMEAADREGNDVNLAEMFLAASINGLVFMDCNEKDGWVPTPICSFFVYWDVRYNGHKSLYLFPADQKIPQ